MPAYATQKTRTYAYQLINHKESSCCEESSITNQEDNQRGLNNKQEHTYHLHDTYNSIINLQLSNAQLAEQVKHTILTRLLEQVQEGKLIRSCDLTFIHQATKVDI